MQQHNDGPISLTEYHRKFRDALIAKKKESPLYNSRTLTQNVAGGFAGGAAGYTSSRLLPKVPLGTKGRALATLGGAGLGALTAHAVRAKRLKDSASAYAAGAINEKLLRARRDATKTEQPKTAGYVISKVLNKRG